MTNDSQCQGSAPLTLYKHQKADDIIMSEFVKQKCFVQAISESEFEE